MKTLCWILIWVWAATTLCPAEPPAEKTLLPPSSEGWYTGTEHEWKATAKALKKAADEIEGTIDFANIKLQNVARPGERESDTGWMFQYRPGMWVHGYVQRLARHRYKMIYAVEPINRDEEVKELSPEDAVRYSLCMKVAEMENPKPGVKGFTEEKALAATAGDETAPVYSLVLNEKKKIILNRSLRDY